MNTYKCSPGASISTSIDPEGSETVIDFDKDGTFSTDNFHLITVLDQMAADPRSPVTAATGSKAKAEPVAPAPDKEDEN